MKVRTWLCINALEPAHLKMAHSGGPDILHFDLEDSVHPDKKALAREVLSKLLCRDFDKTVALRLNSLMNIEGLRDLLWLTDNKLVPEIVILGKARIPEDIDQAYELLSPIRPNVQIYAVIETAAALIALSQLKKKSTALHGVIFGAADFATELRVELTKTDLSLYQSQLILAARRLGILCIDSPCFSTNETTLDHEIQIMKNFGFDGKIAIHPHQIKMINVALSPTKKELECAEKLIETLQKDKDNAVVRMGEEMRGPPFLKQAQFILSKARGNES